MCLPNSNFNRSLLQLLVLLVSSLVAQIESFITIIGGCGSGSGTRNYHRSHQRRHHFKGKGIKKNHIFQEYYSLHRGQVSSHPARINVSSLSFVLSSGHQSSHNHQDTSSSTSSSSSSTRSKNLNNNSSWLNQTTRDILDTSRIPIGQLTNDDVESVSGLMAQWARRKSVHSAIQVETLLKRVVDDHNAGNSSVKVTTRMYTMAIDAWAKTGGKQAAERASEIHRGMVEVYRLTGDKNIRPNTISYNAVINAWSKSGCDSEAAMRAEGILHEMLDEWRRQRQEDGDGGCHDDDDGHDDDDEEEEEEEERNNLGRVWNKQLAGGDLNDMKNEKGGDTMVKPDVVSFTSVIDTWAKSGNKHAAAKAMTLLKQMEKLYVQEGQRGMKPNVYTYSACINAFAKSNEPDAPIQAEALLKEMKMSYEAGDMDVKPNVVNYNSVINAWGRCKSEGAAERALHILNTMESEGVEPDALSYSLVVSAWAHSSYPKATKQAEIALLEMEKWAKAKNAAIDDAFDSGLSDHDNSNGQSNKDQNRPASLPAIRVHLDVECYNTVLIALSRKQEKDAPDRAMAILRRMQYLADHGFETVRPNARSWNSVLNTLSRASEKDSAERAERLLYDMHQNGVQPDVFSYAAILHAYQKHPSPSAAERADNIVRQMELQYFDGALTAAPDVYHYTIVCSCWARSGQSIAAQRCWEILQHMKTRVDQGFEDCKPNVRTYNAVIDAYARGYHVEEAEKLLDEMIERYNQGDNNVKPDGFTFNSVINAWTRSRRSGCGKHAEMILKRLLEFHESGNRDVIPDSRSFSHIIDYYSRSHEPDAGNKAEWLLIGMMKMYERGYKDVEPSIFTFVAVINTYAKSKSVDAGRHADRVLLLLVEFQKRNNIKSLIPNTFVMNAVLNAWSKSGHDRAGERAEEILLSMQSDLESGKSLRAPNTRTYGLVLAAWAKSSFTEKAIRARKILNRMIKESKNKINDHVSINVHCYNAVLNAVAFTEADLTTRIEAFYIASMTLDELINSKNVEPTSSSFGTFIKACGKLSLPVNLAQPAIQIAFTTCISLGLVNDFVLTQMRYSLSDEHYQKILGDVLGDISPNKNVTRKEGLTMSEIPNSWKRNVATPCFDERGEWWNNDVS